jgi:hypothetical protein
MLGLLTFGTLSLIQQLGTYHDSIPNLLAASGYIETGHIIVVNDPRFSYPLTYILWGTLMEICNLSVESLLKYHALILMILYAWSGLLLGKYFFKGREYFIYFIVFMFIFGSRFVIRLNPAPQTLGIIASIFFLALTFKSGMKFRIIQIMLFLYICLSHAISSYYTIFLLVAILISHLILYIKMKNESLKQKIYADINIIIFTFILFISWFFYVAVFTMSAAVNIVEQMSNIILRDSGIMQYSGSSVSTITDLYRSGNLSTEYFISNRFGWIVLFFIVIICMIAIALSILKKEYEIGILIVSMVGIVLMQFYLSSYMTQYGSVIDRAFLFMMIPAGLAFAYFCDNIKCHIKSRTDRFRGISISILIIIVLFGIFNIYLSHYTDNYNALTPTELKVIDYNNNFNMKQRDFSLYMEGEQEFKNSVVVSRQIGNIRSYREGTINNTLNVLEEKVKNTPDHAFIYTNGNIKYYKVIF